MEGSDPSKQGSQREGLDYGYTLVHTTHIQTAVVRQPGQAGFPDPCIETKHRELVSKMQRVRIRAQKRRQEPWWRWIDTRTPSGRVLPY